MIELKQDNLVFTFPEVHPDARLEITFQRTLRIPDDGETYPLPPGLGSFPLRHVDDFAKNVSRDLRIIGGGMSRCFIPFKSSCRNGAGKNSLSKGNATQRRCIKAAKGMEWISLDIGPCYGFIQKGKVKCGIVTNENCPAAAILPNSSSNSAKDPLQRIAFIDSRAQRVIRINAVDGK